MLVGLSLWFFFYLHFLPGGFLTVGAFAPAQDQFSHFSGQQSEYNAQKPMARHKNHCAYVVDKMVSFTVQEGVTPVMKAEYNKCDWGEKCPNVKYRMYYKPKYKVAHKTVTELKWKCCPGYAGVGCTAAYGGKARPPFKGAQPAQKGSMPSFNNGLRPAQKGPASSFNEQMPAQKGPMPPFKGPRPAQNGPMHSLKRPMPAQKSPMSSFKGPMPMQKNPASSFQRPFPGQQGPGPFFKGPNSSQRGPTPFQKGPMPSHKGPMRYQKGPMPYQKGPMPPFKGQTSQTINGNHWNQPNVPSNGMNRYQGPNPGPSSQDSSVDPYAEPQEPDVDYPEPIPEPQDLGHEIIPDENEPITDFRDPHPVLHGMIPEHGEVDSIPGAQTPSGGQSTNQVHEDNDVENERLDRMEEDVQRISIGLETLRGTVTSLEDNLRTSLREDANRMLTALISAAPSPLSAPSLSRDSSVGFGDLPGAAPDFEGSDVVGHIPNLVDLVEKVSELRSQLEIKASELAELRGAVLNHNNTLQKLSNGSVNPNQTNFHQTLETLVESKMSEARVAILDGFEKRVENAEDQCVSRLSEVRLQCKEELEDGQDQIEQMMNIKANGLKTELQKLHARLQNLEPDEGCCIAMSGLTERVVYLEQSVGGLNDSQGHLRAELGGHKDHVEGMLEGRLGYVEEKMVAFSQTGASGSKTLPSDLEEELDRRLKAIETRLLNAVEELGNATSPALLEGQAVPTLETEVEVLRKKVEDELHRLQQQFKSLEVLCTSACASQPVLTGYAATTAPADRRSEENREELHERLELQVQRMSQLNATLTSLQAQLAEKQQDFIQGEVTLLKVSVNSVNRSICGLQESLGSVIREVSHSNLTWQEREDRLAQQVKGVVQLVGRQASMLGTGDRRLTRLKGELQDLRRRVTGELQGCRSTALGVQKEVSEVGGRVARVEGQCGGLAHLADDLERIRGELERHSDGYLAQVNTTLVDHSKQLSELRNGLQNCTGAYADGAGDKMLTTAQYTTEEAHPRGDQFAIPSQHRGD